MLYTASKTQPPTAAYADTFCLLRVVWSPGCGTTQQAQVAILHEGDEPGVVTEITYEDLLQRVCRVANAMKELGVKKGDFVTLYMPMVPEAAVAMLACARLGAPHSVVFAGFSAEALRDRIVVSVSVRLCPGGRRGSWVKL